MTKRKQFEDPLEDIDPIMAQAFIDHVEPQKEKDSKVEESYDAHSSTPEIADIQFPPLTHTPGRRLEVDTFSNIPITVSVELGRSQISLKQVLELSEGSIIELERLVGEPLDLVVSGQIVAHGEVVAIDNNYGLRVTNVINPAGAL